MQCHGFLPVIRHVRVLQTLTKGLGLDLKRASSVSAYVLNFIERYPFWEPSELKSGFITCLYVRGLLLRPNHRPHVDEICIRHDFILIEHMFTKEMSLNYLNQNLFRSTNPLLAVSIIS